MRLGSIARHTPFNCSEVNELICAGGSQPARFCREAGPLSQDEQTVDKDVTNTDEPYEHRARGNITAGVHVTGQDIISVGGVVPSLSKGRSDPPLLWASRDRLWAESKVRLRRGCFKPTLQHVNAEGNRSDENTNVDASFPVEGELDDHNQFAPMACGDGENNVATGDT